MWGINVGDEGICERPDRLSFIGGWMCSGGNCEAEGLGGGVRKSNK